MTERHMLQLYTQHEDGSASIAGWMIQLDDVTVLRDSMGEPDIESTTTPDGLAAMKEHGDRYATTIHRHDR